MCPHTQQPHRWNVLLYHLGGGSNVPTSYNIWDRQQDIILNTTYKYNILFFCGARSRYFCDYPAAPSYVDTYSQYIQFVVVPFCRRSGICSVLPACWGMRRLPHTMSYHTTIGTYTCRVFSASSCFDYLMPSAESIGIQQCPYIHLHTPTTRRLLCTLSCLPSNSLPDSPHWSRPTFRASVARCTPEFLSSRIIF